MKQQQTKLGKRGTLLFLALISAFPPLTTDLYLPAMPQMVEALATSHSKVNMTVSMFFIFYAGGLLFWGPLSEKLGRKPILLAGLGGYIISSLQCAFSIDIEQLISFRIFQAFSGSGVTVVATAIVKDLYDGREREKVMATVMSMVIISPMIAPVLGAFLLKIASWRLLFVTLAGFGAIAAILTFFFQETLHERFSGSVLHSWGRLVVVMKNSGFSSLLVTFSIIPMGMMAYIASSSFIYIIGFGLSEQEYSFFFAFNALFALLGPTLYIRLSKYFTSYSIISVCFVVLLCCGILVTTLGHLSPVLFALVLAPATLAVVTMRIPGVNLMLDQQDQDSGSASALINFFSMVMGSVGMFLISLEPQSLTQSLGTIQIMVGVTGGLLWFLIGNRYFTSQSVQEE